MYRLENINYKFPQTVYVRKGISGSMWFATKGKKHKILNLQKRVRLKCGSAQKREWTTIGKVCKLFLAGKFVFCFCFDSPTELHMHEPESAITVNLWIFGEFLSEIEYFRTNLQVIFLPLPESQGGQVGQWDRRPIAEGESGARAVRQQQQQGNSLVRKQHEYIGAGETAGMGPPIGGSGFCFRFVPTGGFVGWSAMRLWEYLELLLRTAVLRWEQ